MLFSCMKVKIEGEYLNAISVSSILFSNALYKFLSSTDGNVLYSPVNIHALLSLIYQGADGYTAKSLENVLYLSNTKILAKGYQNLLTKLYSEKNIKLYIANKVFINEKIKITNNFNFLTKHYFLSGIELIDFMETGSVEKINNWIENKTNKEVKYIVDKEDFSHLTCITFVNAIYFKGDWMHKFDQSRTKKENFYISEAKIVECDMMHTENRFACGFNEDLDAYLLNLPYKNQKFSLFIILPSNKTGIIEFDKKLGKNMLQELYRSVRLYEVALSLPKFKLEVSVDLNSVLIDLGLGVLFSTGADFSNMSDNSDGLHISKVVQKVILDVGEGDVDVTATSDFQDFVSITPELPRIGFQVDHPFLFSLLYHENKTIFPIFFGAFKNPEM